MSKLRVQLVVWNGAHYLPFLIASLEKQTFRDFFLDILDNASTDETRSVLKMALSSVSFPYSITESAENNGFAGGHNLLFSEGDEPFVALLNQDMVLLPECFSHLVAALTRTPRLGIVSPRLYRWDFSRVHSHAEDGMTDTIDALGLQKKRSGQVIDRYTGVAFEDVPKTLHADETLIPAFGISGTFPVIRRSVLQSIAFQKEEVFDAVYHSYKEDVDLAYRIWHAGYDAAVVLPAIAYHDRSAVSGERTDRLSAKNKQMQSPWVRYHSYKNHLMTVYKNTPVSGFLVDFFPICWYEGKKFCWFLLYDRSVLRGLREIAQHRAELRKKRRQILSTSVRSLAEWRALSDEH